MNKYDLDGPRKYWRSFLNEWFPPGERFWITVLVDNHGFDKKILTRSQTTCKYGTIVGILTEILSGGGASTRNSLTILYRETADVLAPQRAEMVTPLVIHGTPSIELFWFCDNSPSLIRHPFLFEFSLHGREGRWFGHFDGNSKTRRRGVRRD